MWNTSEVCYMNDMFLKCYSLKSLPDISKWNTSNVRNMRGMFVDCNSLISLPDISKWNISKVNDMDLMLHGLKHTIKLPKFYIINKSKKYFIYELTYKINKNEKKLRILGKDFIKNNKKNGGIIYNSSEFELTEFFKILIIIIRI